jgi:hypothetical protein
MRFTEVNLFGLYVAPIAMILAVAWIRLSGPQVGCAARAEFGHAGPVLDIRLKMTS